MEWLNGEALVALLTLTVLEIVLGIDNIIFISILTGKLPKEQQAKARTIGLGLAMISRILLLLSLNWIMRLTAPLFTVMSQEISGRDLILIIGGIFLMGKSTHEIHNKLEGDEEGAEGGKAASYTSVLIQIMILDIVFSLDSVITAVGMANSVWVMIVAVVIAVFVMMAFSKFISDFVHDHPTIKMLALSFLIMIGLTLIIEGFDGHVPKGYVYFAMGFSVFVELLNIRSRKKRPPVELRQQIK